MSWPNGARTAVVVTVDNMGEAADLHRGLWPEHSPIGSHFSVTSVIPQFLAILRKYKVRATFFIEAWNLGVYPQTVRRIVDEGHEVAWHGFQHEAWSKLNEAKERDNFQRSFGTDGLEGWFKTGGKGRTRKEQYVGFRPPGGVINGKRTLDLCRAYDVQYISPAGHDAAIVPLGDRDSIVVLPFRWSTVDAYYYMEKFSRLREIKGELPSNPQTPQLLVEKLIAQIDDAMAKGSYLSVLFHPFLTDNSERLEAFEKVVAYLADQSREGHIWLARCQDVQGWIREHPSNTPSDLDLDETQWS